MFSKENLTNSFISDPKTNWIVKTMITQQALVMRAKKKTTVTTTLILVEIPMKNENGKEIRLWGTALCRLMWTLNMRTLNITPTEINPLYRQTMLFLQNKLNFMYWQRKFITYTTQPVCRVVGSYVLNMSLWC